MYSVISIVRSETANFRSEGEWRDGTFVSTFDRTGDDKRGISAVIEVWGLLPSK
ncbi:MAG: hypothetical protein JWR38_2807 [Mucilaginibacter sp.]|nr:hypothetical protein [Mucilaginibacter sp.]